MVNELQSIYIYKHLFSQIQARDAVMPATGGFMTYLDQFHESSFVLWCVRKFVYPYVFMECYLYACMAMIHVHTFMLCSVNKVATT